MAAMKEAYGKPGAKKKPVKHKSNKPKMQTRYAKR